VSLYLDTSALVKLYVAEAGSDQVRQSVRAAERVVSSRVAYPEARAAFARRQREGGLTATELRGAVRDLNRDFPALLVVELTPEVADLAGEMAERHALRGFDAIHLASAVVFGRMVGQPPEFLSFDAMQMAAWSAASAREPGG